MSALPAFQIDLAACGFIYAVVFAATVLFALLPRNAERRTDALRVLLILFNRRQR